MKINRANKGVFDTIINIFAWFSFFIAFLVALTAIFASFSDDQNGKKVFGNKLLIVASDSMSKSLLSELSENEEIFFETGDVILIKDVSLGQVFNEGDVITFISYDKESYGKTITHKIREVKFDAQGEIIGYVTYGINTGVNDKTIVRPENIIGYYSAKIPNLGNIFTFLKTPSGYFLSILTPSILLIIFFSIKVGKAVGQRKILVDYDFEMDVFKKRLEELENKLKENNEKRTGVVDDVRNRTNDRVEKSSPTAKPLASETATTTSVENYSVEGETATNVASRLEINGTKKPFSEKILSLNTEIQAYFNALHNELCSYKKLKARLSRKCMSYRVAKKLLAKVSVRGKTLTLNLALNVNEFNYNTYFQKDTSKVNAYKDVPFAVKVKSDRGFKKATSLVNALATINGLEKNKTHEEINIVSLMNKKPNEVFAPSVADNLNDFRIKVKKASFTEKLERLNTDAKGYYNEIREQLNSYKKVSERLSFKCLSYRKGRNLLAKITVRGKTLTLHLALDVNSFNKNKYFQKDMSIVKAYKDVPFAVKVKSNRAKNNAIELIKTLMNENQLKIK